MTFVETIHRFIGYSIPAGFMVLFLVAMFCLAAKKEPHSFFWGLLGAEQAIIVLQLLVGAVLFASGRVPASNGPSWLHYIYGAAFPGLVLLVAHVRARKAPAAPWLIFGVASFICAFSTFRAIQTGLGLD